MIYLDDLAARINHIGDLLRKSDDSPEASRYLARALHHSCSFLKSVDSQELCGWPGKEPPGDDLQQWTAALLELAADPRQFEQFLAIERTLLVSAGMEEKWADWIVREVRHVPRTLTGPGDFWVDDEGPVQDFGRALQRLERTVCEYAEKTPQNVHRRGITSGIMLGIGGACVVAANVGAAVLLSPVVISASSAAGAGLVVEGTRDLMDALLGRRKR